MDYTQLKTAIQRFSEMLDAFQNNIDRPSLEKEAIQDSLVKRFEYTLEVAWKICKKHLEEEGFAEAKTGSPKSIIRLAAQTGLINNPESWLYYMQLREDLFTDFSKNKIKSVLNIAESFQKDMVYFHQIVIREPVL